jgi:translocation and assembly module TamB
VAVHPTPGPLAGAESLHDGSDRRVAEPRTPARILRLVARSTAVVLIFVASAVLGAIVHLDTPRVRLWSAHFVNAILAPLFQGQIHIDRIGALGPFGISNTDATINDATGRPVIVARGVRSSIRTLALVRSALLARGAPLTIDLFDVSIDQGDVRLDTDAQGRLDLVRTFDPRTSSPSSSATDRGVRLVIRGIALGHVRAHGQIAGAPALDVDANDVAGAFAYSPDAIEGDVVRASIAAHRIANGADVVGSLRGHIRGPSDPKAKLTGHIDWQGLVGGIAHSVRATIDGDQVDATIEAPHIDPSALRSIWVASPLDRPAAFRIESHGTLPDVHFDANAALGDAGLHAAGLLFVGADRHARVSFESHGIDIRDLFGSGPASRLGMNGDLTAAVQADGAITADATLRIGGSVGSHEIPAASIRTTVRHPDTSPLTGRADVVIDEPSAPTRLHVTVGSKGLPTLDFALTSDAVDLDRVPQLHRAAQGSAHVRVDGSLDLGRMTVDARVQARAAHVARGSTRADRISLEARVHGVVADPQFDVTLHGEGLVVAGERLSVGDVRAVGRPTACHVVASVHGPDVPAAEARFDAGLDRGLSLTAIDVALARSGERAVVTANRVRVDAEGIRVEDARIQGLGAPMTATFAMSPATVRLQASTAGIDLARAGRLVHVESPIEAGTLAFDADVDVRRSGGARGRATLTVSGASIGSVRNGGAALEVQFAGRTIAGKAHADVPGVGSLGIDGPKIEIAGTAPLSIASWRQAYGSIGIDAHVDLTKAAAILPAETAWLGQARGDVVLRAHGRRDPASTPEIGISVMTHDFAYAPRTPTSRQIDGVLVVESPPWHIEGVDFDVDGSVDAQTGRIEVVTRIHDHQGNLTEVHAASPNFPVEDLFKNTDRLASDLRQTAFDVHVAVPERGLGDLPDLIKQDFVDGTLKADLRMKGTVLDPEVAIAATLGNSHFSSEQTSATPIDFDIAAHYDGRHATASVKARANGRPMLDFEGQGDSAMGSWLDRTGSPAWKASARAHFSDFPLETIPALDDRLVSGRMSGDCSLVDLHDDARLEGTLDVEGLQIGSYRYRSAQIKLGADGHGVDADVRIEQTDGFAEVKARAAMTWGSRPSPTLDPARPLDMDLTTQNFRIGVLQLFLGGTLDELDGRLDGETHIELDPKTRGAKLSGNLALSRGAIEASAGGGEFHDIAAKLRFSPDGTIALESLTASGVTGRLQASGSAHLDRTRLTSAKAVIEIPRGSGIPISAAGAEVGTIDGRIEVSAVTSDEGRTTGVRVTVPHLRVVLPDGSANNAIALEPMPRVRIGVHRGQPDTFVLVPIDPVQSADSGSSGTRARLNIAAKLVDVQVVRGTEIRVDLDGGLTIAAGATTDVTGQIHLKTGGQIAFQGKNFTVESGTVTMVGPDPSNPQVLLKAGWTAPDGTIVYANFIGPLKTGKVTLTSEPQLPQQQIVELLVFGSAVGQQAQSSSPSATTTAVGPVGGQAAQPLNHLLNQFGLGAVTATVDTTQSANPKPEVAVRIARDITVQIAYVLGVLPPGVNPDTTLVTVDWRFVTQWSLASTLGNAGSAIFDLLWRTSY